MALMELTRNPNIILPGMLVITTASLVTSEVFAKRSIFLTMLQNQGLSYQNSPIIQALRRVSVGAIMDRSVTRIDREISYEAARELLKSEPKWLVVEGSNGPSALLPSVDLARFLEHLKNRQVEEDKSLPEVIDLMEMPANRRDIAPIQYQATLEEALDQFESTQAEALYVQRHVAPMIQRIYGIVLKSDIESYYQYRRS
jgi:CIC family chloride channel protein